MTTVIRKLEERDGIVSLAWLAAGRDAAHEWQLPWGGQGQRHDGPTMGIRESLVLGRIPETESVLLPNPLRPGESIPGVRANARRDTGRILGIVNRTYPHETYERTFGQMAGCAFDANGRITGEPDGLTVSVAGTLGHGEQAFMVLRLHDPRAVAAGAHVQRYIVMHSGCDGHTTRSISYSTISPVCANTLTAAMNGEGRMSRRHGSDITTLADAIREYARVAEEQDAVYARMAGRTLTDSEADAAMVLQYGRKRDGEWTMSDRANEHAGSILAILNGDGSDRGRATGVRPGQHTAWDLLQAGTYYLDGIPLGGAAGADEGADAGEEHTGPTMEWMHREHTDSIVNYRQRLTDTLIAATDGANLLEMVGAA